MFAQELQLTPSTSSGSYYQKGAISGPRTHAHAHSWDPIRGRPAALWQDAEPIQMCMKWSRWQQCFHLFYFPLDPPRGHTGCARITIRFQHLSKYGSCPTNGNTNVPPDQIHMWDGQACDRAHLQAYCALLPKMPIIPMIINCVFVFEWTCVFAQVLMMDSECDPVLPDRPVTPSAPASLAQRVVHWLGFDWERSPGRATGSSPHSSEAKDNVWTPAQGSQERGEGLLFPAKYLSWAVQTGPG